MCKGREFCYVLGKDPSSWSSECPLPPPDYFEQSVDLFEKAIEALLKGDKTQALIELQKSESEKVKEFFVEHGQQSAYFRVQNRKEIDKQNKITKKENTSPRLVASIEKQVFARDHYRCRYCGLRIIAKEVFSAFSRIVGSDNFSVERKNSVRNGLTLGLRGVADHVNPYASGGQTDMDNLVTSCYSCNFGKAGYTLKQMRIEDPRERPPIQDSWVGLTQFVPALKKLEREVTK
jgi:5-methylcytosine-specific restriction endonuclease McrA